MKLAMFTDIHWGAKGNSVLHNNDCLDYIDWFIDNVKRTNADGIIFMGDWFENRNAINVGTLNKSYEGLSRLDSLRIPIYFCIGNHDLYHRSNRSIYSTFHFKSFKNVVLINEIEQHGPLLFSPFLFREEYATLAAAIEANRSQYVFGHFEFRNFVVTGSDRKMEHGPDHTQFSSPKFIFSGHYHKRQAVDNVIYIGNTFPTNFGDAWDDARGMALLDTDTDEVDFIDWPACPKYRKIKLSSILENSAVDFDCKTRVRCLVDIDIAYSEAQDIKQEILNTFNLREFSLEENLSEKKEALETDESFADLEFSTLNDAVVNMLKTGITNTTSIDADRLIQIYQQL